MKRNYSMRSKGDSQVTFDVDGHESQISQAVGCPALVEMDTPLLDSCPNGAHEAGAPEGVSEDAPKSALKGEPPVFSNGKVQFTAWLSYHKQKWEQQRKIRQQGSTEASKKRRAKKPRKKRKVRNQTAFPSNKQKIKSRARPASSDDDFRDPDKFHQKATSLTMPKGNNNQNNSDKSEIITNLHPDDWLISNTKAPTRISPLLSKERLSEEIKKLTEFNMCKFNYENNNAPRRGKKVRVYCENKTLLPIKTNRTPFVRTGSTKYFCSSIRQKRRVDYFDSGKPRHNPGVMIEEDCSVHFVVYKLKLITEAEIPDSILYNHVPDLRQAARDLENDQELLLEKLETIEESYIIECARHQDHNHDLDSEKEKRSINGIHDVFKRNIEGWVDSSMYKVPTMKKMLERIKAEDPSLINEAVPDNDLLYRYQNRYLEDTGGGWDKDIGQAFKNLKKEQDEGRGRVWLNGGTSKEDFVYMIWQSNQMKRLLLRYGQECILLDATYKVLRYKRTTGSHYPQFLLAVPTNDGYQPVAVVMAKDTTYLTMVAFLEAIRDSAPSLKPRLFMTDDCGHEHHAIETVWAQDRSTGYKGVRVILCDWHLRKAWDTWLRGSNDGGYGVGEDYQAIRTLLKALHKARDFMTYTARLKDLQESKYWLEPAHSHFRKYFEDKYLDQTFLKRWARWARPKTRMMRHLNTNNGVESMHRVIKTIFGLNKGDRFGWVRYWGIIGDWLKSLELKYIELNRKMLCHIQPAMPTWSHQRPKRFVEKLRTTINTLRDQDPYSITVLRKGYYKVVGSQQDLERVVDLAAPFCPCYLWSQKSLPCKHMVAVLLEDPGRWEEVSKNYTHSVFLTADTFGDEDDTTDLGVEHQCEVQECKELDFDMEPDNTTAGHDSENEEAALTSSVRHMYKVQTLTIFNGSLPDALHTAYNDGDDTTLKALFDVGEELKQRFNP